MKSIKPVNDRGSITCLIMFVKSAEAEATKTTMEIPVLYTRLKCKPQNIGEKNFQATGKKADNDILKSKAEVNVLRNWKINFNLYNLTFY